MNKFLTALIVGAISATTFAAGNSLVYDYKASVKRINPVTGNIKYTKDAWDGKKADATKKLESYSVASDTLQGYLVLTACSTCAEDGWIKFNADENKATLLVTRKGDKKKLAWKFTDVDINGGVFNKGVGVRPAGDTLVEKATSLKKIKSAWMWLEYSTAIYGYNTANKVYGGGKYPYYGILGEDYKSVEIINAGFGKAVGGSQTDTIDGGICGESSSKTAGCVRIDSISGSLVGYAEIDGPCGTPMWDACELTIVADAGQGDQPSGKLSETAVSGTWSIKFNKKQTKAFNTTEIDELALLKAKAANAQGNGFANENGGPWDTAIINAD